MKARWVDIALLFVLEQVPTAAAAIMCNLTCYCSIANAASIWYINILAPTLFRVPCRCNLHPSGDPFTSHELVQFQAQRHNA